MVDEAANRSANAGARFQRWLEQYRRLIYRVVVLYAPHPDAQEDLFQDIALALWRSVERFEGRSSESTWIYRVALNTAVDRRRRADRQPKMRPLEPEETSQLADGAIDDRLEWLYAQIRRLSLLDRSLALLYLDGNSYEDIAAVLGISSNLVGVKLNRMRARLKKLLEAE